MSFQVGVVRSHKMANGAYHVEVLAAEGYPTMCGILNGRDPFPLGPEAHYWVTLSLREHCDHEGPYRGPRSTGWEEDQDVRDLR